MEIKFLFAWLFKDKFFSAKFNYEDGMFKDYSVIFH